MPEERLKLAVFIDLDNIEIGVKETLGKDFDVSLVLEALKDRGEVVTKIAYGDWHRHGEQSRQMTQHAIQMVQRNVNPRGDKNAADINLALDALEMAFTRHHINAFAIVGGDSDYIPLVEKLRQYDKRVFVVGGRGFTSSILQRNCHEFIAYENLLKDGSTAVRSGPSARGRGRAGPETRALSAALPYVERALKILAEREVAPQLGLLKSTILQLDPTFSERDYGAGSFLEFMQKIERQGLVRLRRTERSYLVETVNGGEAGAPDGRSVDASPGSGTPAEIPPAEPSPELQPSPPSQPSLGSGDALTLVRQALVATRKKAPNRPLYLRQVRQALRSLDKNFDERHYGPRGTLDLLQQAQREGWVKLERDRRGFLRIFPTGIAPDTPLTLPQASEQTCPASAAEDVPSESDLEKASVEPQQATPGEAPVPQASSAVAAEAVAAEATPAPRTRKARTEGAAREKNRRASHTHRRPKDPAR